MKRKILLALVGLFSAISALNAQIVVQSTIGPSPVPYPDLTTAFAAINAGTHQGMIGIGITGSYTEPGTAVLNGSGAGSASYQSVRIAPLADGITVSCATASGRGIIELNGADSIIIDGDNPLTAGINRNLTFQNTAVNTTTFTSCIRLATSTVVLSCDNVTIRNLNLLGAGTGRNISSVTTEITSWGVVASGAASTVSATTAPSALTSATTTVPSGQTGINLQILNNNIQTVSRGVAINGSATTAFPGVTISNNTIGNATTGSVDQVTVYGVTVQGSTNAVVSGNTIRVEGYTQASAATHGINIGTVSANVSGVTISSNKIERVINNDPSSWSAFGINIAGGTGHIIRNNFIGTCMQSQVAGTGSFSTTFGVFGIRLASGTGHSVEYNTVHFTGVQPGATSTSLVTCFGMTSTTITGCSVRNNVFSNQLTGGNATSFNTTFSCVYMPTGGTSAMNLNWNNNAYYQGSLAYSTIAQRGTTPGTGTFTAPNFNPAAITPATNWRSYTSTLSAAGTNDNASLASTTAPPLISGSNLHVNLSAPNATDLFGTAVVIPAVTVDIDGDTRNLTTPDIGADEFILVLCSSANGGTITPSTINTCVNQTVSLTSTGATAGLGITYQWKVSTTSGGPYLNVTGGTGATTTAYTSAPLVAGTYYYVLQATCSAGPVSGLSNEVTVTVNTLPVITATPATATYCNPGPGVALTASGGVGYAWSPSTGLSAAVGANVTATPASSTTYTVTGTDLNGCTATSTSAITVSSGVAISSITANPIAVCSGDSSHLNVVPVSPPTSYVVNPTTYGLTSGALTAVTLGDDNATGTIALPFGFYFYGTLYNNLFIHSNGFVTFTTGQPTGSPYVETIPTAATPNNYIAICHDDLNVTGGGTVGYMTDVTGGVGNRIFIIDYTNVKFYNTAANNGNMSGQIKLFESDYHIEVHVTSSDDPAASAHTIGIENATGTVGVAAPGRNNVTYSFTSATPEAWTFTNNAAYTYAWSPGAGMVPSASVSNPTTPGLTAASNIYTVTVTVPSGCTATSSVTVSAGSALASTAVTSNSPVCQGSTLVAVPHPSGGGAPYTYKWNYGAGQFTGTNDTLFINTIPAGTFTLTSTVLDACGDSTIQSASITINARPAVSLATTPAGASICPGTTYSMTGSGATTYTWSPSTYLSATSGTTVNVSGAVPNYTNMTYMVIGTDGNGCQDTAMQSVTLAPVHELTVTASASTVCSGAQVDLTVVDSIFATGPATPPAGYCTASASCDEAVNGVSFGSISTTSGCTGGYAINNVNTTNVLPGASYPISVTTTLYYAGDQCKAWGDWNRDGDFLDAGEQTNLTYSGAGGVFNGTVLVPANAQLGATGFRIRMTYTGTNAACGTATFGETEDYTINIGSAGLATGPNTYTWNPVTTPPTGQTVSDFPVASTNYIVTSTDSIGCTNMDSVFVVVDQVVATLAPVNITCNGANNGSFTMTGYSCGTPGFSFSVDGGAFGAIPTNLTPGTHSVIVRDTVNGLSSPININITQPAWTVPAPGIMGDTICVGDPSAWVISSLVIADTITVVVPFNVTGQPTETNAAPGNIVASANMPAIPGTIISAVLSYPGIQATGNSWMSDIQLGFQGAVNDPADNDPNANIGAGTINYLRNIPAASFNLGGGNVDLLYWDIVNDNAGSEATFPLGATAATLTIKYVPSANLSWWNAPSAGTNLGNNDSLQTVGTIVLPNSNTAGSYNFYAQADYNGCTSATRSLAVVQVGAYPVVSLGADAAYCNNHILNAGNPGDIYLWNDGSTAQTLNALDTGLYYVDVTSPLGCTRRDSINLIINPLPTVDLGPDTTSCGSYTLSPGTQPVTSTYLWNNNATTSTLTVTSSGDWSVTVTDINGCANSDTATINVPPITYTNIGPDTVLCTNDAGFTLDAYQPGLTYQWQDGSTDSTFFVDLPGVYWVDVTNFVNCTSRDSIVVTSVNPSQTNINVNFITANSATLDAGAGYSNYVWSTSATTQVITVTANGTYYVQVSDGNNCVTTDTVNIVFSLGIFNPDGSNSVVKLYPNPSEGAFNLSIDNLETSNLFVEVMDMNGKVVYTRYIGSVSGSVIEPFDLTTLRAGTYNLRITANGKSSSLRFIVK